MSKDLQTTCCIAGGGPAGMMLGLLLARSGVDVTVIEKYPDFFRDFRGDTIHPSTMQILHEINLLQDFLKVPHQELRELKFAFGGKTLTIADFTHLPVAHPVIGIMPQWDFLNFISEQAKKYQTFHLLMGTEVTDLITENGTVKGVVAKCGEEEIRVHSKLVVGADGRHSTVREKAGFKPNDLGAPMDVLWFRLSKHASDPEQSLGNVRSGKLFVMINRGEYWQCGYVIPKGTLKNIRERGLEAFGVEICKIIPYLQDRVSEFRSWDDIKLLDVQVNRLSKWYKRGLLCIGDAAHAMSPVGGVGINLAIQDAVAAANALVEPLLHEGEVPKSVLRSVQKRRESATRLIQGLQVFIQEHLIKRVLKPEEMVRPPFIMRMLNAWPLLRRLPARLIGLGWRMEHVETSEKL